MLNTDLAILKLPYVHMDIWERSQGGGPDALDTANFVKLTLPYLFEQLSATIKDKITLQHY